MAVTGKQTLGAADEAAQSLTGQLAILSETANQAKERIGGGLVQALGGFSGPNGAGGAAQTIENLSIKLTNAITGFGYLVQEVKIAQPILVGAGIAIGLAWAPWFTALSVAALAIGAIGNKLKNSAPSPMNTGPLFFPGSGDGGYKEREAARKKAENEAIARNKQLAKLIKDQAKSAMDALKAKRLQNAIDKANLALNKGSDVFDLDKIQIAAALTSQAEQLGKATSSAQVLQIANDVARLNVKKSILALEDAIASKDEAAIIAATNKLNADLKILGALTGQNTQMSAIKSILDGLKPKSLIDQANLDEALRKIKEMLEMLAKLNSKTGGGGGGNNGDRDLSTVDKVAKITAKLPASVTATDFFNSLTEGEQAQLGGYQPFVGAKIPTTIPYDSGGSTAGLGNNGSGRQVPIGVTINVNTGIGDPNAIAEAIDQVLTDAATRGTLRGYTIA
jgi:hypothetical protein